jgi:hypothetical protein
MAAAPIILLIGQEAHELDVEAMHAGAADPRLSGGALSGGDVLRTLPSLTANWSRKQFDCSKHHVVEDASFSKAELSLPGAPTWSSAFCLSVFSRLLIRSFTYSFFGSCLLPYLLWSAVGQWSLGAVVRLYGT